MPGLIKAIEVQLLSSDLSTSVIPPSTDSSFLRANSQPDPDPNTYEPKRVLFRAPESDLPNKNNTKKAGVLVQIVQVDDVAHSALSLKETLEEKKEARKLAAKGGRHAGGGGGDGGRIMDLNEEDDDEEDDLDAEAKRRALLLGGGGQGAQGPSFPRGNGRFVLTDGGPAQWTAFELQRIAGLGLEELRLGTKVRVACLSRFGNNRTPRIAFAVDRPIPRTLMFSSMLTLRTAPSPTHPPTPKNSSSSATSPASMGS